jgi:hypothetical protein
MGVFIASESKVADAIESFYSTQNKSIFDLLKRIKGKPSQLRELTTYLFNVYAHPLNPYHLVVRPGYTSLRHEPNQRISEATDPLTALKRARRSNRDAKSGASSKAEKAIKELLSEWVETEFANGVPTFTRPEPQVWTPEELQQQLNLHSSDEFRDYGSQ